MGRFILVFLTMLMSIGVNLDEGFLVRLGIDPNILYVALISFVVTGLIAHRHLALIVIIFIMAYAANVPIEAAANMGYDPDYILAGLVAIIFAPLAANQLDFNLLTP